MRSLILLLAILLLTLSPAIVSAQGSLPPCRFYGTVHLDGVPVPDGTVVTAIVQGDTHTTKTPAVYGDSTYAIVLIPPEGTIYTDGASVTFIIGNYYAFETGTWETGLNIPLNLTASTTFSPTVTPSPTPSPTPMPTIIPPPTPTPAITPTPVPTPTPAPPKAQLSTGRVIGLVIFGIVNLLLIGVLVYLLWRFFLRGKKQQ